MAATITVNGVDLSTIGVYLAVAPGAGDASERRYQSVELLQRAGSLLTSSTLGPRTITFTGSIDPAARTVTALDSAIKLAKDLFYSGPLVWTMTDTSGNVSMIGGVATRFQSAPRLGKQHWQAATVADVSVSVLCDDPTWRDVEPTMLAMAASTRVSLPLGTAPSLWVVRCMGASPTLTYRTAGGTSVWALTLSQSITANEDWFDFDARTGRIWYSDDGSRYNAIGQLVTGQQDWPKPLDPQDGDYATSQWPTIEATVASEILYYRRWL